MTAIIFACWVGFWQYRLTQDPNDAIVGVSLAERDDGDDPYGGWDSVRHLS